MERYKCFPLKLRRAWKITRNATVIATINGATDKNYDTTIGTNCIFIAGNHSFVSRRVRNIIVSLHRDQCSDKCEPNMGNFSAKDYNI
ncbi:unnamed protein product [Caenorhabditis brenneri]